MSYKKNNFLKMQKKKYKNQFLFILYKFSTSLTSSTDPQISPDR